jgi:hypothetical protein
MMASKRYQAAVTVGDVWICYPWEAEYVTPIAEMHSVQEWTNLIRNRDIDEQDRLAAAQKAAS